MVLTAKAPRNGREWLPSSCARRYRRHLDAGHAPPYVLTKCSRLIHSAIISAPLSGSARRNAYGVGTSGVGGGGTLRISSGRSVSSRGKSVSASLMSTGEPTQRTPATQQSQLQLTIVSRRSVVFEGAFQQLREDCRVTAVQISGGAHQGQDTALGHRAQLLQRGAVG